MSRNPCCAMAGVAAAICFFIGTADGSMISWTIDSSQSKLTLAIPDTKLDLDGTAVTVRIRNQSSSGGGNNVWNVGNSAPIAGTLETNYTDGLAIKFFPTASGVIVGVNSGNYRPNPAAFNPLNTNAENPDGQYENTSTAPAVFGARARASVSILTVDAGFLGFHDVSYNLTSASIPIAGFTTFPASSTDFGILESKLDFDGVALPLGLGQPIPDILDTPLDNLIGPNSGGAASIISLGGLMRQMTIPIVEIIPLDLGGGVVINATATGTIVATALVPEPSTFALGAAACIPLALIVRCSRRRLRGAKA